MRVRVVTERYGGCHLLVGDRSDACSKRLGVGRICGNSTGSCPSVSARRAFAIVWCQVVSRRLKNVR